MHPKMKNKIIKGVITEIDWRYIKKQRVIGGKKCIISSITCLLRYNGNRKNIYLPKRPFVLYYLYEKEGKCDKIQYRFKGIFNIFI